MYTVCFTTPPLDLQWSRFCVEEIVSSTYFFALCEHWSFDFHSISSFSQTVFYFSSNFRLWYVWQLDCLINRGSSEIIQSPNQSVQLSITSVMAPTCDEWWRWPRKRKKTVRIRKETQIKWRKRIWMETKQKERKSKIHAHMTHVKHTNVKRVFCMITRVRILHNYSAHKEPNTDISNKSREKNLQVGRRLQHFSPSWRGHKKGRGTFISSARMAMGKWK